MCKPLRRSNIARILTVADFVRTAACQAVQSGGTTARTAAAPLAAAVVLRRSVSVKGVVGFPERWPAAVMISMCKAWQQRGRGVAQVFAQDQVKMNVLYIWLLPPLLLLLATVRKQLQRHWARPHCPCSRWHQELGRLAGPQTPCQQRQMMCHLLQCQMSLAAC